MTSSKKLVENSFLYTFSGILTKCINFFLLPIYTASLTAEDYGIYSLIGSFTGALTYLVMLGLENAIIRFFCEYEQDKAKLRSLISACILPVFCMDILVISGCFVFRNTLCSAVLDGVGFFPYVLLALVELVFVSFNTMYRSILRASGEGRRLSSNSLGVFFLSTILTLLFVVLLKKGAVGMLSAMIIARGLLSVVSIIDLKKRNLISFKIDFPLLKKSLKYSVPLLPHEASGFLTAFFSKMFLNNATSLASVGVYNIASQISLVIDTIQDSVGKAFRPWLNETLTQNPSDRNKKIAETSEFMMSLFSIFFIGIAFFSYEVIVLFFNETYSQAWKIIPILVLACSSKAIYYFYIYKCFYYTNTANKIFLITIVSNLLNIFLSYFLSSYWGIFGTAIAQLCSDVIRAGGIIALASTQEKIGYRFSRLLGILLLSWMIIILGVLPAFLLNTSQFSWPLFIGKIVVCLVYAGVFLLVNRKKLLSFFKSFRGEKHATNET